MYVIFKGPLNPHYELTSREKLGKSFDTQEDAREFLLKHFERNFSEHGHDADNDIWWGKNKGDSQATGFLIQNG